MEKNVEWKVKYQLRIQIPEHKELNDILEEYEDCFGEKRAWVI